MDPPLRNMNRLNELLETVRILSVAPRMRHCVSELFDVSRITEERLAQTANRSLTKSLLSQNSVNSIGKGSRRLRP